jgi:hypothetical protein
MSATKPVLSVYAMFAEREALQQKDREAAEQLQRRRQEELAAFKKRVDDFELTNERVEAALNRVKRAFERGERELMLTSFASSFCSDDGRAISNGASPPVNKPEQEEGAEKAAPEWVGTMRRGAALVYEYWKQHLQPGGFGFSARIINYPGGKPGDVGLFLTWPKNASPV